MIRFDCDRQNMMTLEGLASRSSVDSRTHLPNGLVGTPTGPRSSLLKLCPYGFNNNHGCVIRVTLFGASGPDKLSISTPQAIIVSNSHSPSMVESYKVFFFRGTD